MNKVKEIFTSDKHSTHHNSATSDSSTGAGLTTTGSAATNRTSDKHSTHHNLGTSDSSAGAGLTTTGSAATTRSASSIPSQHAEEVARAPSPGHVLPKRDTHLAEQDAHAANHDHKHLAAVTRELTPLPELKTVKLGDSPGVSSSSSRRADDSRIGIGSLTSCLASLPISTFLVDHTHQKHEVQEVERERHIDRHLHHVQHHVQPVVDTKHESERHRENVVPTTKIHEKHVNTDADTTQFAALNKHQDEYKEAPVDRVIVDKGERVNEETHHHVHHVIQPVIERDTHEHHVIHTKVPIHHETHEAPIVHQSVEHQPMKLSDFVAGGGDIKSKLTHENAGVLHTQDESCKRTIDGPLESLKDKLHLGSTKHDAAPATNVVQ